MKNWIKIAVVALLIACLGLMGATGLRSSEKSSWRPETVNLALRQVAHELYSLCDNHTSRIDAVEQEGDYVYTIKIDEYVDYDQLPEIMDRVLRQYDLPDRYTVALINCDDGKIELGYAFFAPNNGEVACKGREFNNPCSLLELTFFEEKLEKPIWSYLFITLLLGSIIGLVLYSYANNKRDLHATSETLEYGEGPSQKMLELGKLKFDYDNQILISPEEEVLLTFRESKLLHYLATHPNQVLTRDQIQANVWEDEGVIVGRSLDVFISRLRKILKRDESIQIKSVHGVGYRLEIR